MPAAATHADGPQNSGLCVSLVISNYMDRKLGPRKDEAVFRWANVHVLDSRSISEYNTMRRSTVKIDAELTKIAYTMKRHVFFSRARLSFGVALCSAVTGTWCLYRYIRYSWPTSTISLAPGTFRLWSIVISILGVAVTHRPPIDQQCYASAVLAMGLCPSVSVCLCVRVCHKPVFY